MNQVNASSIYGAIETTDATELLTNIPSIINCTTTDLENGIDNTTATDLNFWLNISIAEISIEFANCELSPQISFETLTFELPVKNATTRGLNAMNADDNDNSTWNYADYTYKNCNDYASKTKCGWFESV